jgi:muconolactone delta-isomerase
MKYMVTWHERPQGSAAEYERAQSRILGLFRHWEMPSTFKVGLFVVRIGEWGGHLLIETDDALALHKLCSTFPAFTFGVHPVLDIGDAVPVELEGIAWRERVDAS